MATKLEKVDPWITVDWPASFPRSLEDVARDVGWQTRRRASGTEVCLTERGERRPVTPLRLIRGGSIDPTRGARLDRMKSWTSQTATPDDTATVTQVALQRSAAPELAVRLSALRLLASIAPSAQLPALVNEYLRDHLPELHGGSAWLVEPDRRLFHGQIALARNWYRAENTPEIIAAAGANPDLLSGGMGLFASDVLGAGVLLIPLLAALAPMHLGAVAPRVDGTLVLLFPEPVTDPADSLARTMPDLLAPAGFISPRLGVDYVPGPPEFDREQLVTWWIQKWNGILGQLVDPSIHYWPPDHRFSPLRMVGRFVSLIRLLTCVQEVILHTARDEFIRLLLCFDALDILAGFGCGMGSYDRMADPSLVEQDLERIEEAVQDNAAAQSVLLPRCRSAVKALTALRKGFVVTKGDSVDAEVHRLISALRNAKHGFDKGSDSEQAMDVFMRHRINVPADLADIAWFHLIRFLCFARWRSSGELRDRMVRSIETA